MGFVVAQFDFLGVELADVFAAEDKGRYGNVVFGGVVGCAVGYV